jgi:hypothetical protein
MSINSRIGITPRARRNLALRRQQRTSPEGADATRIALVVEDDSNRPSVSLIAVLESPRAFVTRRSVGFDAVASEVGQDLLQLYPCRMLKSNEEAHGGRSALQCA